MTRATLASLAGLLLALPAAAQGFADGTTAGGSSVFSAGEDPRANPARFDQLPEGFYLAGELGDLKPRGAHDAAGEVVAAEGDPALLPAAEAALAAHPWSTRVRAYGLAWAWTGGLRFGFTHEDLRGTFAGVDPVQPQITLDARQVVVDRLYAGAGSLAGHTAFGFTVRLERVRLGQAAFALAPGPGQAPLGDPEAPLDGLRVPTHAVTSATVDAGLVQDLGERLHLGLTLDRLASRRFGDLREDPQGRAGLQADLGASVKLSVEADLNGAERLPFPVKRRIQAASLRVDASPSLFFTVGAERRRYEGAPASTLFAAALHLRQAAFVCAFGLQLGDDRPLAAATFRLPGAP